MFESNKFLTEIFKATSHCEREVETLRLEIAVMPDCVPKQVARLLSTNK